MAKTETIHAIADRLEITVEGESSSDEKESVKDECREPRSSSLMAAISSKRKQVGEEDDSTGDSSNKNDDMQENSAEAEEDLKQEYEEMKTVDFIKESRIKKQEALQSAQKRRLIKIEKASKAKGKLGSDKTGYKKPDYGLDREKERKLVHAATKGVVQLFNAVSDRQKFMDKKLEELNTGNRIQRRQTLEEIKSANNFKKIGSAPKRMKLDKAGGTKQESHSNSFSDAEDNDDIDLCGPSEGDQDSDDEEMKEEVESTDESD